MSEVKIGKIYKNAFNSIITVVNACNITNVKDRTIRVIDKNTISYGENTYVYDDSIVAYESEGFKYKLGANGANWFDGLRKAESTNSFDSEWKELIENVATMFHQEYSFFDFNQAEYQDDLESDNERREKILKTVSRLFSGLEESRLRVELDNKNATGDVYGAILKLEINDGTREAQTILCKVYFDKYNNEFRPILAADAIDINESFLKTASSDTNAGLIKNTSISDSTRSQIKRDAATSLLNALINLMSNEETKFEDYYFLHHKSNSKVKENGEDNRSEDEKILDNIIDNAPSLEYVDIHCKKVSLLTIIHAKWKRYIYKVKYNGMPTLEVRFGLNNKMSLRCLVCNSKNSILMADKLVFTDDNGTVKQISIFKDNGEFINNLEDYVRKSRIKDHLFKIDSISNSCKNRCRNINCNKLVCSEQLVTFDNNEKKCKLCQYPEVVYINKVGNPLLNKGLIYLSDVDELVPDYENPKKCNLCKRHFLNISTSGLCSLCEKVLIDEEVKDDIKINKKIYKSYSKLLPLHSRISFSKRRGYEDNELLILKLGKNNIFVVDKLSDAKKIKINKLKKNEIKKLAGGE